MNLINCIIMLLLTAFAIATAPPIDVVFIVHSPDTKYHHELSRQLKKNIIRQSIELQTNYRIKVHLLHEIFNYPGDWTIHNLIPQLVLHQRHNNTNTNESSNGLTNIEIINDKTRWIVFCEDKTKVRLKLLIKRLNDENHVQPLYLGHPLYDREPTIIHHFAFFKNPKWFPYPMLRAGVVLSAPLFQSIADIYANEKEKLFKQHFSIDAGHELAKFIYDNIQIPLMTSTTAEQKHATTCSFATASKQTEMQQTTTNHRSIINNDVVTNAFDVSHSDHRPLTTNEITGKHESEVCKPSGSGNTTNTTARTKTSLIKKQKIILKKASYICPTATWENSSRSISINSDNDESCAMYAQHIVNSASSVSCTPVKREEIYFAVKTCSKYHYDRLPIIQATWTRYATHVKYFSDIQDNTIPTTYTGVPNVEVGHCAKTLQILKLAFKDIENYNKKQRQLHQINQANHRSYQIQWLVLSDDDTLLSVSGVCEVLGCYNSMDEIYLGERYGYRLFAKDGFNYITGGGGIAFSLPVVKLILQHCSCPSPTAPDDMILGSCLHSLQLKALHSSRFHQARPNDYPPELLKQERPVSFHKFWQIDPFNVHKRWFSAQDDKLMAHEKFEYADRNSEDNRFKSRGPLSKTEALCLNKIPASMMTSLHHSKERHIDL